MKIYFAGSIRGGRDDQELYQQLITALSRHGHVLTEHIGHQGVTDAGEALPAKEIFERDVDWIRQADVLIAECTQPSMGVGYEIGLAESLGKPILALFRPKSGRRLSGMVEGNVRLQVKEYEHVSEAEEIFKKFFLQFV